MLNGSYTLSCGHVSPLIPNTCELILVLSTGEKKSLKAEASLLLLLPTFLSYAVILKTG